MWPCFDNFVTQGNLCDPLQKHNLCGNFAKCRKAYYFSFEDGREWAHKLHPILATMFAIETENKKSTARNRLDRGVFFFVRFWVLLQIIFDFFFERVPIGRYSFYADVNQVCLRNNVWFIHFVLQGLFCWDMCVWQELLCFYWRHMPSKQVLHFQNRVAMNKLLHKILVSPPEVVVDFCNSVSFFLRIAMMEHCCYIINNFSPSLLHAMDSKGKLSSMFLCDLDDRYGCFCFFRRAISNFQRFDFW